MDYDAVDKRVELLLCHGRHISPHKCNRPCPSTSLRTEWRVPEGSFGVLDETAPETPDNLIARSDRRRVSTEVGSPGPITPRLLEVNRVLNSPVVF